MRNVVEKDILNLQKLTDDRQFLLKYAINLIAEIEE